MSNISDGPERRYLFAGGVSVTSFRSNFLMVDDQGESSYFIEKSLLES